MLHRSAAQPIRLTLAGLVASVALALAPAAASAATHKVRMGFNDFSPATVSAARGDTVRWVNPSDGFLEHDVKSTAPAKYFSSGKAGGLVPGDTYTFTFDSAGTFAYYCSVHPESMKGTVRVPIKVTRLYSPARFRVTAAASSSSSPWKHEIQVQKPGSSAWTRIALTTSASVTFTPGKHGTFHFRSRVTNTTTGADSGWSPTVTRSY
jgi:plastocyanin